jgi:hypothetical protein
MVTMRVWMKKGRRQNQRTAATATMGDPAGGKASKPGRQQHAGQHMLQQQQHTSHRQAGPQAARELRQGLERWVGARLKL